MIIGLNRATIPELKKELINNRLGTTGNKTTLQLRLKDYFNLTNKKEIQGEYYFETSTVETNVQNTLQQTVPDNNPLESPSVTPDAPVVVEVELNEVGNRQRSRMADTKRAFSEGLKLLSPLKNVASLDNFLEHVEFLKSNLEFSDAITMAIVKMRLPEEIVLKTEECFAGNDWAACKKLLKETLSPKRNQYLAKLRSFTVGETEDLEIASYRLLKLVKNCGGVESNKISEIFREDFEKAITKILGTHKLFHFQMEYRDKEFTALPSIIKKYVECGVKAPAQLNYMHNESDEYELNYTRGPIKCYKCNGPHKAANCPKPNNNDLEQRVLKLESRVDTNFKAINSVKSSVDKLESSMESRHSEICNLFKSLDSKISNNNPNNNTENNNQPQQKSFRPDNSSNPNWRNRNNNQYNNYQGYDRISKCQRCSMNGHSADTCRRLYCDKCNWNYNHTTPNCRR